MIYLIQGKTHTSYRSMSFQFHEDEDTLEEITIINPKYFIIMEIDE